MHTHHYLTNVSFYAILSALSFAISRHFTAVSHFFKLIAILSYLPSYISRKMSV
jgi:hypothetical protein